MTPKDRVELEKLQAALRRNDGDTGSRLKLADLYSRVGRLDDAIAEYFRAATGYQQNGFYLKAAAVHRHVLKSRPDHAASYRLLSEIYSALGLGDDAVAILHTYLAVVVVPLVHGGQSSEALEKLRALGDLSSCSHDAQAIVLAAMADLAPNDPDVLRPFAAALIAGGRTADAAVAAERALRANPDDLDALETLAFAFVKLGEVAKARAALESLVAACERIGNQPRLADARERLRQLGSLPR